MLSISKSKKQRLRKSRAKRKRTDLREEVRLNQNEQAVRENDEGYKYNSVVRLQHNFYRTNTFEILPPRFILSRGDMNDQERVGALMTRIFSVEGKIPGSLIDHFELKNVLKSFVRNFQRLNMKALLNKHCPRKIVKTPCPPEEVYSFLNSIILQTGVSRLFGHQVKHLQRIVRLVLMKTVSNKILMGDLMQGIVLPKIQWMSKCFSFRLKSFMLARLLSWFVTEFVCRIISSHFHRSDSTHKKHQIFYYRKVIWQSLTKKAMNKEVQSGKLKLLTRNDERTLILNHPKAPPCAKLRFIPKKSLSEVRLIGKSVSPKGSDRSLLELVRKFSSMFGSRADLSGNILCQEWTRLVQSVDTRRDLFWITVDISDAFGSVRLSKLVEIIKRCRENLSVEDSLVRSQVNDLLRRLYLYTGVYHVGGTKQTYHLRRGLLQGDPLSPFLSDIYYGDMVSVKMIQFSRPPAPGTEEVFLRGADDFIFVSTDRERISSFRETILNGFADYNCIFKSSKTRTNIDSSSKDDQFIRSG